MSRSPGKRAFTLIEMLATTALAALLLITGLSMAAGLARQQRMSQASTFSPQPVLELLRWDLANATKVQTTKEDVVIDGFAAMNSRTLGPAGLLPTRVIYKVEPIGGHSWLVRQQSQAGHEAWSALVCQGVAELSVEPLGDQHVIQPAPIARPELHQMAGRLTGTPQAPSSATQPAPTTRPTRPVPPAQVRLKIQWDDPHRADVDEVVVLR